MAWRQLEACGHVRCTAWRNFPTSRSSAVSAVGINNGPAMVLCPTRRPETVPVVVVSWLLSVSDTRPQPLTPIALQLLIV